MLFIDNYDSALQYQKELMICWLKVKIRGVGKTENVLTKEVYCKYCNTNNCSSLGLKKFDYTFNLNTVDFFSDDILENLITGIPSILVDIHINFYRTVTDNDERNKIAELFKFSGYKNYLQKKHSANILKLLNRSTCTYCNRNYTLSISKRHASAQLDHWFPKDKFPLFSVSFFNLIPSCSSCNHIKGNSGFNENWWINHSLNQMLHPYFSEEDHDFNFTYILDSKSTFSVELKNIKGTKMSPTLLFNRTKYIYNAHAELELKDLYDLRKKYPKNYLNYLMEEVLLDIDLNDKYRLLFGIEMDKGNFHKRPMSKFKSDIIKELINT